MAWLVLLLGCSEYDLQRQGDWPPAPGPQPDALEPGELEDVFEQRQAVASDILFVVDNSGSMGEEQVNLGANFDAFAQRLFGSDVDFHIGLVRGANDGSADDGRLLGVPTYVEPSTVQGEQELVERVTTLGADGPDCESGLHASRTTLSEPALSGPNAGFYRPEALLTIVIVTDENDHAGVGACDFPDGLPEEWAAWLGGLKPSPSFTNLGVIAGFDPDDDRTPADCSSAGLGAADAAIRQGHARDLVGGISQSICNEDWNPVLDELGLLAAGLTRRFPLTRVPVTGDDGHPVLEVWLDRQDGAGQVQTEPVWSATPDPVNPWSYDAVLNAVVYELDAMPLAGWTVRAIYPNDEEA